MSDAFPPPPPPPPFGQSPMPGSGWVQPVGDVVRHAGFWQRLGAAVIDWFVMMAVSLLLAAVGAGSPLLSLAIGIAYWAYFEGVTGQTLGKMAVSIKVIDPDSGETIGVGRAIGRYVGKIISAIPLALGFFWMLWDSDNQTWHDKMVRSVVVEA